MATSTEKIEVRSSIDKEVKEKKKKALSVERQKDDIKTEDGYSETTKKKLKKKERYIEDIAYDALQAVRKNFPLIVSVSFLCLFGGLAIWSIKAFSDQSIKPPVSHKEVKKEHFETTINEFNKVTRTTKALDENLKKHLDNIKTMEGKIDALELRERKEAKDKGLISRAVSKINMKRKVYNARAVAKSSKEASNQISRIVEEKRKERAIIEGMIENHIIDDIINS